ncbi:LysM peptidoglycan-binding domain-containing protein [Pelagimonas varians]|uniref:LysM domain/BON superfamily protein n=1 Tax=Pelagimonas varians TaxID=696760 RepID=A0A238KZ12_9RHOB|nr:hypothetical protein [Pelagimonas varians]PYG27544.1 nucleoid-associated protein YgaU [Pelagimonas varians]SMX48055.1 LysM domain/BON superfamily protein [Pelagimonas varians]
MSKIALYSAIAGTGSVGVVVVAVATGALDLSKPDPLAVPAPAALVAPDVGAVSPKPAPQPDAGEAASLVADPEPEPVVDPESSDLPKQAVIAQEPPVAVDDPVVAAPIESETPEPVAASPAEDPVETAVALPDVPAPTEPVEDVQVAALAQPEPETNAPAAEDLPSAVPQAAPPVPSTDPTPEVAAIVEPEAAPKEAPSAPAPGVLPEEAKPVPAPQVAEAVEPVSKTPAPTFDIVRTETDGSTLIAGAAVPGSQLDVMLDGKSETSVTVGSDGRFVTFLDLPTEGAASVLTLRNETDKGVSLSEQEVIITPAIPVASEKKPQKEADLALVIPENAPLPVVESSQTPVAEAPVAQTAEVDAPEPVAPQVEAQNPPAPVAPQPVETAIAAASAPDAVPQGAARSEPEEAQEPAKLVPPTILLSSARGVEVLQTAPLSPGDVALDSISYDEQGDVLLAGRGEEASSVRIYLDNTPVTTSRIREDGRWRVELPQVDTGTYTLRVDQIDDSGVVIARVESLFLRESAEVLTRAAASGGGIARSITVQPGHTLWEISNNRYGDGKEYVRVFEANRDRIGDPDLIYPGQIFDLPK